MPPSLPMRYTTVVGLLMLILSNGSIRASDASAGILLSLSGGCLQDIENPRRPKAQIAQDVARAFYQTIQELNAGLRDQQEIWVMNSECRPEVAYSKILEFNVLAHGQFVFINSDINSLVLLAERRINELEMFYIVYRITDDDQRTIRAAKAAAKSWMETVAKFNGQQHRENRQLVQGFLTRSFNTNIYNY